MVGFLQGVLRIFWLAVGKVALPINQLVGDQLWNINHSILLFPWWMGFDSYLNFTLTRVMTYHISHVSILFASPVSKVVARSDHGWLAELEIFKFQYSAFSIKNVRIFFQKLQVKFQYFRIYVILSFKKEVQHFSKMSNQKRWHVW